MINIINEKVVLNKNDLKSLQNIYSAFGSYLDYCATLLKFGNDNQSEISNNLKFQSAVVNNNIEFKDYKKIFELVFVNNSYEIIDDKDDEENYLYQNYLNNLYTQFEKTE